MRVPAFINTNIGLVSMDLNTSIFFFFYVTFIADLPVCQSAETRVNLLVKTAN